MTYDQAEQRICADQQFSDGRALFRRVIEQAGYTDIKAQVVDDMLLSMLTTAFITGYVAK